MLPDLASDQPALYTPLGLFAAWDKRITDLLNEVRGRARTGVAAPEEIVDVRKPLDALRLVKDAQELALMRRAAEISSRRAPAGDGRARGRAGTSTRSKPSSPTNSCTAARRRSRIRRSSPADPTPACCTTATTTAQLQDGELLLIDAGCEYQSYASDITRTFPVNGKFTGPQKDVYELVLAAQQACLDAVKPGVEFHDYHKVAERVLAQGYIDLGLCEGTLDEVLESGSYKQFYMHRAGHWLGLDVHDAGLYQVNGASQKLVPGMVLTVEPGTYIRRADNVPEAFWDIGVRIEDDVLVTATGHENLTHGSPKSVADVEAACPGTVAFRTADGRCREAMHDVVIVGAGPVGATLALALRRRRPRRRRARRARAGQIAARRPLARAVARRAPHPRAPGRLVRARGDARRRHADHRDRRVAGRRLRHDATCRRRRRSARARLRRELSRAAGGARRRARRMRASPCVTT